MLIRLVLAVASAGFAALSMGASAAPATWMTASTSQRCGLLELYTSEGCSSCPPADRWLGHLEATGLAPGRVIPLAFHVDYWDALGWRDRFASPEHTRRQQRLARISASGVYTPQFLFNGRPLMDTRQIVDAIQSNGREMAAASIRLSATYTGRALRLELSTELTDPEAIADSELFVALYENGLVSEVLGGENRGRVLRHDRVVRQLAGPLPLQAPSQRHSLQLSLDSEWDLRRIGVAAFVQRRSDADVLQAVNLSLPGLQP